jgi:REP element-mobilizing transposase RayT
MPRSKVVLYLHFVWATYQLLPLITPDIEESVYAVIQAEAKRCGLTVLAIGGMPDHVHLLVRKPATITVAQVMQRIKGVSSTFVRQSVVAPGTVFRWQEHYAVFSFHSSLRDRVVEYVHGQKKHHTMGKLIASLEATEEDVVTASLEVQEA